jgi:hypothetical protein
LHAWKQLANIAQNRNNSRGIAFLLPYGTQTKEVPVANPDRDTVYTNDGTNRTIYSRESNSTGWFVGIIVALALLAIAYLVFSANSQPSSTTINNTPAVTTPAPADTTTTPMARANDNTGTSATPMAPATTAPADNGTTTASSAAASTAPASSAAAPASSAAPASDAAPASSAAQ